MISFQDGPAAGQVLELARSPLLLRIVVDPAGQVDALDQLMDTPGPAELVHVYVKAEDLGSVHIDYTDRQGRRRGKTIQAATYRYYEQQPDGATVRDNLAWRKWAADRQRERMIE